VVANGTLVEVSKKKSELQW